MYRNEECPRCACAHARRPIAPRPPQLSVCSQCGARVQATSRLSVVRLLQGPPSHFHQRSITTGFDENCRRCDGWRFRAPEHRCRAVADALRDEAKIVRLYSGGRQGPYRGGTAQARLPGPPHRDRPRQRGHRDERPARAIRPAQEGQFDVPRDRHRKTRRGRRCCLRRQYRRASHGVASQTAHTRRHRSAGPGLLDPRSGECVCA